MWMRRVRGPGHGCHAHLIDQSGEGVKSTTGFEGANFLKIFAFEEEVELRSSQGAAVGCVVGSGRVIAEVSGWIRGRCNSIQCLACY